MLVIHQYTRRNRSCRRYVRTSGPPLKHRYNKKAVIRNDIFYKTIILIRCIALGMFVILILPCYDRNFRFPVVAKILVEPVGGLTLILV